MKPLTILRIHVLFITMILSFSTSGQAQTKAKPLLAVLSVEINGLDLNPTTASMLVRMELEKTNQYTIIDKYDIQTAMKKAGIRADSCFGKTCLVQAGKVLQSDKMLAVAFDRYADRLLLTMRLVDVQGGSIEKTQVDEYLNLPENVREMISLSVNRILGQPYDDEMYKKLTTKNDYASEINNPSIDRLKLNGPRMGVSFLTGSAAQIWQAKKNEGGFEAKPYMYVFGYQSEIMYLNSGRFQALFEFLPAIVGLDQGFFIPSLTFMNGFRDNRTGWEFAFGPNVTFVQEAQGYYDGEGRWHLQSEDVSGQFAGKYDSRLDSRGGVYLQPSFIVSAGKTFKSGRLNIPIDAYFIPSKAGARFGIVMGFNGRRVK